MLRTVLRAPVACDNRGSRFARQSAHSANSTPPVRSTTSAIAANRQGSTLCCTNRQNGQSPAISKPNADSGHDLMAANVLLVVGEPVFGLGIHALAN